MPEADVTELLALVSQGDREAQARLIEQVYPDLRAIAQRHMRAERPEHTLQTTALVNEAYLKLMGGETTSWRNRSHFLASVSLAVRAILIDYARRRATVKRGNGVTALPLDERNLTIREDQWPQLLDLDSALRRLEALSPRKAKVVSLRFFGDMTDDEIAEALQIKPRTVRRDWFFARAWLHGELSGEAVGSEEIHNGKS
jgi:RNA polymerase sigma factor (TIGR02999 family)